MKTITFYSYKGGVGRSMTLANVAWRLAAKGKRIAVLDLDLEAPGLSLVADFVSATRTREGGLAAYLHCSDKELAEDTQRLAERRGRALRPEEMRDDGRDFGIGAYCHWIAPEAFTYPGVIAFLPVGGPSLDLSREIVKTTQQRRVISIREAFASLGCEYLLVDSRTGFNATSQVASVLYPDEIVMVLGLNSQNIKGTHASILEFRETIRKAKQKSGTVSKAARELRDDMFYLLPSLVPAGEEDRKQEALKELRKVLVDCNIPADHILESMSLPYHPQLAVDDRPMILEGFGNFLAERYVQLASWIVARNPADPLTRRVRAAELLEAEGNEEQSKLNAEQALRLIGGLYRIPPFENEIGFLRLYATACIAAGFTVEATEPIDHVIRLEIEADRKAGRRGVPSISTILLKHQRDKKATRRRDQRLSYLLRARSEGYPGSPAEVNRLYGAIKECYDEPPIDIPGALRFHDEVLRAKPDYASSAAAFIANFHAAHGKMELADSVFQDAYNLVRRELDEGKANRQDLARVLSRWADHCDAVGDTAKAAEKLQEATVLFDGDDRVNGYLMRARLLADASDEPRATEITVLEQVLAEEPHEKIVRVIKRVAELCEEDGRYPRALELCRELMKLEPWNRRDALVKAWELEKKLNGSFPDQEEAEARRLVELEPDNLFSVLALGEMLCQRGKLQELRDVYLAGARHNADTAATLPNVIANDAQDLWKDEAAVDQFLTMLRDPVFLQYPTTYTALVKTNAIRNDWEAALAAARQGLDASAGDQRTKFAVAAIEILERLGRCEDALQLVDQESRHHAGDVQWPATAAEAYLRAAASEHDPGRQRMLLDRSLAILDKFELETGPMQLDKILPLRYNVLVERLGDEQRAREDLALKRKAVYKIYPLEAVKALTVAELRILTYGRQWEAAIRLTERMAWDARDEEYWLSILKSNADLRFVAGQYESALDVLDRLGAKYVNAGISRLFLRLRCEEALERDQDANRSLKRIRDHLKSEEVQDMDLVALSAAIRSELRRVEAGDAALEKAMDCVRWIEIEDVNRWSPSAQAAVALYYQVHGDAQQVEQSLQRLGQIGNWYDWVAEFIHDLKIIGKRHPLQIPVEKIEARFPLDPSKPIPQPE